MMAEEKGQEGQYCPWQKTSAGAILYPKQEVKNGGTPNFRRLSNWLFSRGFTYADRSVVGRQKGKMEE